MKLWLRTITLRVCTDWRRRQGRGLLPEQLCSEETGITGAERACPEHFLVADEERLRIRGALQRLRSEDRELILLRYYANESGRDIARALGITVRAVQKRLERVLERMGRLLNEESKA